MSAQLKVVQLDVGDLSDVSAGLRRLADGIDAGEYGDAHNLAWVIDSGNGETAIGMLGKSASPGTEAYYLYGLAMRKLEQI